jgi:type II restriction enzyme
MKLKKGNKGEWSELYALLKILSDKFLYSADENLALIPKAFIKVLNVKLEEKANLIYEIDHINDRIIVKEKHDVLAIIPIVKISSKLGGILKKIKIGTESKGAFELAEAQDLMAEIYAKKVKSASSVKADMYVTYEDPSTGTQPTEGFSVKSQIGGMSTLLNASGSTNFEFKIIDSAHSEEKGKSPLINLDKILASNQKLEFVGVSNSNFKENLEMIDSHMPLIIAEMIKGYYLGLGKTTSLLTEYVKSVNPLKKSKSSNFYEHKIQELLRAIAFGMQPAKLWAGNYEAHGGYIIVKENGELACYHTYDRDSFGKFLYLNTKFETPSLTRHKFGKIEHKNGDKFIKLNMQIRFTS